MFALRLAGIAFNLAAHLSGAKRYFFGSGGWRMFRDA